MERYLFFVGIADSLDLNGRIKGGSEASLSAKVNTAVDDGYTLLSAGAIHRIDTTTKPLYAVMVKETDE